jgi:hypothetical protein
VRRSTPIALLLLSTLTTSKCALAVGFTLEQQSASNAGYAFSGTAAAEDASAMFWNPASLSRLRGSQIVGGVNAIYGSATFTDQGTVSPAGPTFPRSGSANLNSAISGNSGIASLFKSASHKRVAAARGRRAYRTDCSRNSECRCDCNLAGLDVTDVRLPAGVSESKRAAHLNALSNIDHHQILSDFERARVRLSRRGNEVFLRSRRPDDV